MLTLVSIIHIHHIQIDIVCNIWIDLFLVDTNLELSTLKILEDATTESGEQIKYIYGCYKAEVSVDTRDDIFRFYVYSARVHCSQI